MIKLKANQFEVINYILKIIIIILIVYFIYVNISDISVLNYNSRIHPDLMIKIHNNFPLYPLPASGGIIEVYLLAKNNNCIFAFGNSTYNGGEWVANVILNNTTNLNGEYIVKIYHKSNSRFGAKELWLVKDIELPLDRNELIVFKRSPRFETFTYNTIKDLTYLNTTIKNCHNNAFIIKLALYVSNKPVPYDTIYNFKRKDNFEIFYTKDEVISPHSSVQFSLAVSNNSTFKSKYFVILAYMHDGKSFVPYEQRLDWIKFDNLQLSYPELIIKRIFSNPYNLNTEW